MNSKAGRPFDIAQGKVDVLQVGAIDLNRHIITNALPQKWRFGEPPLPKIPD